MIAFKALLAGGLLALTAAAASAAPLLGEGRGLDHMGIAVRDLAQATQDFGRLGFNVRHGGHFPGGVSNALVFFDDRSYLELLTVAPNHTKDNDDIADFAKKHEGAMFLGLNVSSAKAAADYLRARNFDVSGPAPGSIMSDKDKTPPPPEWYDVYTPDKPAPGKQVFTLPIFFIQYVDDHRYDKERAAKHLTLQPNTATGMRAVWFAVNDVKAQLKSLRGGGFDGAAHAISLLGLDGTAVQAGAGSLDLLRSNGKTGPLAAHEEGIVAISIAVKDLARARVLAQAATKQALPVHDGAYGKSILVAPNSAHGVWIELFQK